MGVVENIAAKPGYFAALGVVSIGLGVGAYFLAGKIHDVVRAKATEEAGMDEYYEMADIYNGEETQPDPDGQVVYEKTVMSENFVKPPIVDYTAYSKRDIPQENAEEKPTEEAGKSLNVSLITMDEYLDASGKYGKADGTYFVNDGILAGWNLNLDVKDVDSTVGRTAIARFDDPDVKAVYVRNEDIMVDFEIIRSDDPYEEALAETGMLE